MSNRLLQHSPIMPYHILSTTQFGRDQIMHVVNSAREIDMDYQKGKGFSLKCFMNGKILASLFFEPSTRTRFSFEAAMLRMGGSVISNSDMMTTSSVKKGETLYDTAQIVSRFADVIVMRHHEKGSVAEFAQGSLVPVINAGDGHGDHPTQALLDLYTIFKEKGSIDGLKIGLIGDLKYSRVFRSQARLLSHFKVNLVLVSPPELQMEKGIVDLLDEKRVPYEIFESVKDVISELDVISTNRIQEERFSDPREFERLRHVFHFNKELLALAKHDSILINPLPRVDEIDPEIDSDPRCKYFEQVSNGVMVRMAILKMVLNK